MAWGPNQAHRLLLYIKFYWDTAASICLSIISGCFWSTPAELGSCERDLWHLNVSYEALYRAGLLTSELADFSYGFRMN